MRKKRRKNETNPVRRMTSTRPASDEITRRSGTASRRYIRGHLSLPNPWHDGRLRVEREKTSSPNHEGKKLGQKKMDRALIAHRQVLCLPLHSFDGSKKNETKNLGSFFSSLHRSRRTDWSIAMHQSRQPPNSSTASIKRRPINYKQTR